MEKMQKKSTENLVLSRKSSTFASSNKRNRDMTKKQKVKAAHALLWWCIALAVDAAVISEWLDIPECGLYSLIAGVVMFTSMSLAMWLVIRDFINHIIKD